MNRFFSLNMKIEVVRTADMCISDPQMHISARNVFPIAKYSVYQMF